MNRFEFCALFAAVVVTALFLRATLIAVQIYFFDMPIPAAMVPVAIIGWIIATYGPIIVAALCWRFAKTFRWGWLLHLLFFPMAAMLFVKGDGLMLLATGERDFDSVMGVPDMTAMLMLLVAVGGYGIALFVRFEERERAREADLAFEGLRER